MDEKIIFVVGGQDLTALPVTVQRLRKMWPSIEVLGATMPMTDYMVHISRIISVATEVDEDKIDRMSLEDLGKLIERKLLPSEIKGTNLPFSALLKSAGLTGGAAPGNVESHSTETGTV